MMHRFYKKFQVNQKTLCWEWTGALHRQGYGHFFMFGKIKLAHRVSWILHRGALPDNLKVCHGCDNPRCVNPDHLFLGSQKENVADCIRKGRATKAHPRGTRNPAAIFSDAQVRRILRDKRKLREIAEEYECAISTISMIKNGRNWPHLFSEWQSHEATARAERRL